MGGLSSRAAIPALEGSEDKSTCPPVVPLRQEPIHALCPLGEDSILTGGADKVVNLYSWKHERYLARFPGPGKDVTKICYNKPSKFVFAASRDRSLYGWQWPIEEDEPSDELTVVSEPSTVLHGHSLGVTALDTSDAYPQLLCSGSRDNSVCLWDLDVGKPVSSMYAPRNVVTDLKWLKEEKAVVQASEDKTLRVWDLTSCSTVQHFRARNHLQTCCAVSDNRQQFMAGGSGSASVGGEMTLWDRRNEKKPIKIFKGHSESITSCLFRNKNLVCSVSKDSTIRLWELDSGQEAYSQVLSNSGPLTDLVSPKNGLLACSSFKGGTSLWKLMESGGETNCSLILVSKFL